MKIFISWSGKRSQLVAELLKDWIVCVIQSAQPWLSSQDIDRGSLWFTEISNQLAETSFGIVCLTRENKNRPWILFESGALAKGLSSNRVCPLLIDLESTEVKAPLSHFNLTVPTKENMLQLVRTINSALGDEAISNQILTRVFKNFWPELDGGIKEIIEKTEYEVAKEPEPQQSETDLIKEVLEGIRNLDRRIRNIESNEQAIAPSLKVSSDKSGPRVIRYYLSPVDGFDGLVASLDEVKQIIRSIVGVDVQVDSASEGRYRIMAPKPVGDYYPTAKKLIAPYGWTISRVAVSLGI